MERADAAAALNNALLLLLSSLTGVGSGTC